MQPGVLLPPSRSRDCTWGSPGGSFGPWVLTMGGICKQWLRVLLHSSARGRLAWSSALIASAMCKGGRDEVCYVTDDTNVNIASICSWELLVSSVS